MAVTLKNCTGFIYGIPDNPERLFQLPPGCDKAKLRFRNTRFATVVLRFGDTFERRMVIAAGDHFEAAGPEWTQGTNRRT
jgi:hypothetical protein